MPVGCLSLGGIIKHLCGKVQAHCLLHRMEELHVQDPLVKNALATPVSAKALHHKNTKALTPPNGQKAYPRNS